MLKGMQIKQHAGSLEMQITWLANSNSVQKPQPVNTNKQAFTEEALQESVFGVKEVGCMFYY